MFATPTINIFSNQLHKEAHNLSFTPGNMLTSNSFPLCPRFRLMEDMLPKDHLKKTRMVVMAALLADPDGGPKNL